MIGPLQLALQYVATYNLTDIIMSVCLFALNFTEETGA